MLLSSSRRKNAQLDAVDPVLRDKEVESIVKYGKFVDGPGSPDTFYRGWYPVRHCGQQDKAWSRHAVTGRKLAGDRAACYNQEQRDSKSSASTPQLPTGVNKHQRNWFKEQINLDLKNQKLEAAIRKHECIQKHRKYKEQKYREEVREAERRLWQQQRQCSFHNPIDPSPPALPGSPAQRQTVQVEQEKEPEASPSEGNKLESTEKPASPAAADILSKPPSSQLVE